jgi:hypothetical protein
MSSENEIYEKRLDLKDLNSEISFKNWLVENLSIYSEISDVKTNHVEKFLKEYIIPKLSELNGEVVNEWKKEIKGILGVESLTEWTRRSV